MILKGQSYYSYATKKNTTGKYPSNKYEINLLVKSLDTIPTDLIQYFKKREDANGSLIGYTARMRSDFIFKQYDANANEVEPVAIPNDTEIAVSVKVVKSKKQEGETFLSCDGVQFLGEVPQAYNPFKN